MSTPEEHSHLGPSGWDGFVRCPGKPNAEREFPDSAGYAAAEGTVFHELVSDCLELGLEPEDFRGGRLVVDGFDIPYDDDMMRYARDGLDFVRSYMADPNVVVYIETRVDISPWTLPGQFGTADVVIVNIKERWIIVFDWKYGKEPVYAEENYQAQGYCLGTWQTLVGELFGWDPSGVKVTIIIEQPRVPGAGGTWDTTMQRVLEFGQHVRRQAVLSTSPKAPRVAGPKQCRWCRARATCGELAEWHLENLDLDLDDLDDGYVTGLPPALPENLTPERRSYLLEIRPLLMQWLDALHASTYHDASTGRPTPGLKLVEGRRPPRKWDDKSTHKAERALLKILGDKAYAPAQILSPTQAEKLAGKPAYESALKRFVDEGSPAPVLVPDKDRRPSLKSALDEFEVL
jgi:hypothetical protein